MYANLSSNRQNIRNHMLLANNFCTTLKLGHKKSVIDYVKSNIPNAQP